MAGYLDQKLAGLKISGAEGQQPIKKIGPAVPPKPKKTQPLVSKNWFSFINYRLFVNTDFVLCMISLFRTNMVLSNFG